MTVKAVELAALRALDTDGCIRLAQDLIRIPSTTGDERAVQERVGEVLAQAGMQIDRFTADIDRLAAHPRFPGMEVERTEAVLIAATLGPKGDRSLILNGHVDVVPPGDRQAWAASPWSGHLHAGRLYGRGACDMKSGIAVAAAAAAALRRSDLPLRGRLTVQSVVGEEDGGLGTFAMIDRGYRADAAIILEPTRLRIVPSQAGALSFQLHLTGRSTHASVRYEGVSALDMFGVVQTHLRELERTLNQNPPPLFRRYPIPFTLSVGKLQVGSWSSTVPDQLECEGRVGVPTGMTVSQVRQAFEDALERASRADAWLADHPPGVEWWGGQFAPVEVDPDVPVLQALRRAHAEEFGVEAELDGAPYGSDMRLFVQEGEMPAVLYGPGDVRQAHAANEWISVDEVIRAARIVTATAARYLAA